MLAVTCSSMQCSHAADMYGAEVDCHCSGTASPTRLGPVPDQKAQLSLDFPKVNCVSIPHFPTCSCDSGCNVLSLMLNARSVTLKVRENFKS